MWSTVTRVAEATGTVNVERASSLSFFGLDSAPGTSFQIVPEPASAALLGLGLAALASRRSGPGRKGSRRRG